MDNEKDQHSLKNTAKAALTSIVGAAAFYRLGGAKAVSKGVPIVGKIAKEVLNDVSDMEFKDYNYKNITKLLKKHVIDDESTYKTVLRESKNTLHKIDLQKDNALTPLIKARELMVNSKSVLKKMFNTEYADEAIKEIDKRYSFEDEKLKDGIDSLIRRGITKGDLISHELDADKFVLDKDIISEYIDVKKLGEHKDAFFEDLKELINQNTIADKFSEYSDLHTDENGIADIVKNITDELTGKTFKETYGQKQDGFIEQAINQAKGIKDGITLGEYLESDKFEDQVLTFGEEIQMNLKDLVKEFVDKDESLKDIYIDYKNLKLGTNDEIIDFQKADSYRREAMRSFAGTLPGKLAKATDMLSMEESTPINLFIKGNSAPLLSKEGAYHSRLDENYVQVLNKVFKIDGKKNELKHMEEFDNMYTMTDKHGTTPRLMRKMFGLDSEREASNKVTKFLDLGTTRENTVIDDLKHENGLLGKLTRNAFGGDAYNIIDKLKNVDFMENNPVEYRKNLKDVSRAYSHIVDAPTNKTISKLTKTLKHDDTSIKILEALQNDSTEEMIEKLSKNFKQYANKDLQQLIKTGQKDRNRANHLLSIKSDKVTEAKRVQLFEDMIKIEAMKEVLMNHGKKSNDTTEILLAIRRAGITGKQYKNLENITYWGTIQQKGKVFNSDNGPKNIEFIKKANEKVLSLVLNDNEPGEISKDAEFVHGIQKSVDSLKRNYSELTTKYINNKKGFSKGADTGGTIIMRKAYTSTQLAKDLISNINTAQFDKAQNNLKRFGMQFVAGKNSPEYVTTYSMVPYFFTERLIEPFNKYGLGFSSENMGNVADQWKAIMTKRVIPTALGISAFSYLNFETKNLTGTSITGAMAQGIANVDLGLRKIADTTGIGYLLNEERKLNPITRYWLGDDYQDYDERKDYYENGYDAVRKGRWWAFGSAAEFRGSKISYFQPNFVKRANSDWKDIGIYGSSDEKWKHSWLPTPRHPLAPIRRALDPYWLERKHYEDRPYMETAPLFSAATPWGVVLNPTVGEIIKPVRKMHRDETRRGLVDPRTLIRQRNEEIRQKQSDKRKGNLIKISDDGVENIQFKPKGLADDGHMLISLSVGNGRIASVDYNGIDFSDSLGKISDIDNISFSSIEESIAKDVGRASDYNVNSSNQHTNYIGKALSSLETTALGTLVSNQYFKNDIGLDYINIANTNIKKKAAALSDGATLKPNLATMPFKKATEYINTKQDEADIKLTTSRYDFINDTLFAGKELGGMYGYLGGLLSGNKGRVLKLENAEKMSSFKRGFWDANIGGFGGGFMEIGRRFFPHDDHSLTYINPIRNTMPEWLPERFLTGDPYTKISKGEMRLPGAGYESIHKLRSDEYGKYGALDRMRILADVAPWSDEYKTWRQIAQSTIKDAQGLKEIEDIKKRVEKQSSSHEFFNYTYLHNPTVIANETVKEVNGSNITTTSGKQFTLGGIKLTKGADLGLQIQAGMEISVEYLKKDKGRTDKAIEAAIYVDGVNINQQLLKEKQAEKDANSVMGDKAITGVQGQIYGSVMELIGHAPIPFIHNKVLKIDSPIESYKNERVYGTPYSTWDHPIKGFIEPAFNKAWGRGAIGQGIALGGWALAEHVWKNPEKVTKALDFLGMEVSETAINRAASVVMNVTNPGAFAGSMMAAVPTGLMSDNGIISGMLSASVFGSGVSEGLGRNAARIGAVAMTAGFALTRTEKPLESTAIMSVAGIALSKQLQKEGFGSREGAIAGAAVGLALSALRNPRFDKDKMFGEWIPEETKRRNDIEEYYDRLEYIKYMGLYNKAARKAKLFERTDIKKIIQAQEYKKELYDKKIEKLNNKLIKIGNSNLEDSRKEKLTQEINSQIYSLKNEETIVKGGKYTKAAVAYKQAADSTIYGLDKNSTTTEILRAIPKSEKDYFMEFSKEKDKKKQKEILRYVSPYMRKALQIAWGYDKIDKVESNESYFKNHFLPGVFWAGWAPQYNLENVKIKTIENEGMLLSDFGIYESQANEPSAIISPSISNYDKSNTGSIGLQGRLQGALNGAGLLGVKVSVTPSNETGIMKVVANISNSAKITEYRIRQGINSAIGTRMFY